MKGLYASGVYIHVIVPTSWKGLTYMLIDKTVSNICINRRNDLFSKMKYICSFVFDRNLIHIVLMLVIFISATYDNIHYSFQILTAILCIAPSVPLYKSRAEA